MPATAVTTQFVIMPAIVCGLVIGLYEAITLIKDVQVPQHKFGHALHALLYGLAATFVAFNVEWAISMLPFLKTIPLINNVIVVRVAIGIITAIKVHAISRATKAGAGISGLSETWFHTFFIGALVGGSPYLWMLIAPALPAWLT